MALITAEKFLERLEREQTLRTQLYVSRPETLEELTQFAHGKGFVCDPAEMKQAVEAWQPKVELGNLEPLKLLVAPQN
jgi:hypothetical protein